MRPITLKINAFGPYSDKVFLDFNKLNDQKIFIIHGPTGAGKTTVLDAIVYALYGKTSGGVRNGTQMRSDYADSTLKTEVEFVFAIGQDEYKIRRSPKQVLKKKRGEGTREVLAEAILYKKKNDDWESVATKSNDIKEAIQQIIGFREEQFLQVMLLPQGEFKKLLLASSKDRADVMRELFKTSIYAKLQNVLDSERKIVLEKNKAVLTRQEAILENEGVNSFNELEAKLKNTKDELISIDSTVIKLREHKELWQQRFNNSNQRLQILNELEEINKVKNALNKEAVEVQPIQEKYDSIKTYEPVRDVYLQIVQLKENESKILENLKSLTEESKVLTDREERLKSEETFWNENKELRIRRIQDLNEVQYEEKKLIRHLELRQIIEERKNELKEIKVLLDSFASSEKAFSMQIVNLNNEINQLDKLIVNEAKISIERIKNNDDLKEALRRQEEINIIKQENDYLAKEELAVEKELKLVRDYELNWKKLEHGYHQGQAYLLAKELNLECPCPVCGSLKHPNKAKEPTNFVEKEKVDLAYELYSTKKSEAEYKKQACENRKIQILERNDELKKISKEYELPTVDVLEKEQKRIHGKTLEIEDAKTNIIKLKKELVECENLIKVKLEENNKLQTEYATGNKEVELLIKEADEIAKTMRYKSIVELEDNANKLANLIKKDEAEEKMLLDKRNTFQSDSVKNKTSLNLQDELLSEIKTKQNFLATEFNDLLLENKIKESEIAEYEAIYAEKNALEEKCLDYKERVKENEQRERDAKARIKLIPLDELDISMIEKESISVNNAYEVAISEHGAKINAYENLKKHYEVLNKLRKENESNQKEYALISNLSDLANGGKTGVRGFTFENYVLRAILEDVVMAANLRLKEMSRGRYALERAPIDQSSQGVRGLDLQVFDTYTGISRPANTLSGGETFLASLSLALGLADVVQSYAGGIHLDTMFVDEGFGTLDSETLDMALKAILKLQEHGRLVGVISHVPELKDRISARLTVEKTERGSKAYFNIN